MSLKTASYNYNDKGFNKTVHQTIGSVIIDWSNFTATIGGEEYPNASQTTTGIPPERRSSKFQFDLSDPETFAAAMTLSTKIWEKHRIAKCIPDWQLNAVTGKRELILKSIDDLGGTVVNVL